jgi:hypothetical protein
MLVLSGAMVSIVFFNVMSNDWHNKRTVTVKESPESDRKLDLVLGRIERVIGSQVRFVELRERESKSSFSSGSGHEGTRNILFFKDKTFAPTWLFDKNEYLITRVVLLKTEDYSNKEPVLSIMYYVMYADTDGNKKLDQNDKVSVAISNKDGSGLKNIISSVEAVIDHQVSEDGKEVDVIYQVNHRVFMERFSLETFSSISKSELTQIEKT